MTEELPGNSKKERRVKAPAPIRPETGEPGSELPVERNKPKPLQRSARVKRKSLWSKFNNSVISEDADNVGGYIFWEVLIPALKTTIKDIVSQGIEMLLYGNTDRRPVNTRSRTGTVIHYGSMYRGGARASREIQHRGRPNSFRARFETVIFDYEEDAGEVIEFLLDTIDTYGFVSVADFYEAAGLTSESLYTDNSWGWTDLRGGKIVRTRDGYGIDLPEPRRLDS